MRIRIVFQSLLLSLVLASVAMACPMCKDSIPSSDAQSAGALPGGFNTSIYFMLGGLFTVMAVFGTLIVRTIRQTDRLR